MGKSRYSKGQTIKTVRGGEEVEMVIKVVRNNPLIPITQYGFEAPNDGFLCGEQDVRALDGRYYTLGECIQN
jgi:hypothetical protein